MLEAQRAAARAVQKTLAGGNLDRALEEAFRRSTLTPWQRASAQDAAFGALRHYGRLKALLAALLEKPLKDGEVRALLLVALYQLGHTNAPPHAVVDNAVKACRAFGKSPAAGLVNAVLRNYLRRREELAPRAEADEEARYGHPRWWVARLREQYPQDWPALLAAGNAHPPMVLRVNARRATVAEVLDELAATGIAAEALAGAAIRLEKPVGVFDLPGFGEGRVSVQDAGAQYAARFLDVQDGMRVLDACAAPGGKAAHILELADADLTALDLDPARLERVRANLDRLGLSATLAAGDAGAPQDWWDGRPFERILADVPCSASGVVRRHPDIKWLRRESDITGFAAQQQRLLDGLWQTLASGGKLLYATCSVFAEENQNQVAAFLQRHPDAQRLPLDDPDLDDGQLLPDDRHDGFFYALFAKA
jgi:16S rRNA (cytosine967-C5)-methyltransferase